MGISTRLACLESANFEPCLINGSKLAYFSYAFFVPKFLDKKYAYNVHFLGMGYISKKIKSSQISTANYCTCHKFTVYQIKYIK